MNATMTEKETAHRVMLLVVVLFAALLTGLLLQGRAVAQQDPYANESPTVLPTRIQQPVGPKDDGGDDVLGTRSGTGSLPFTGADLTLFVGTGLAAIGTGTLLVRRRKNH